MLEARQLLSMIPKSDLRARLSPLAWKVTQEGGTERAFTGPSWNSHEEGEFRCVCCDAPLFDSGQKFDSGTGWPSFWAPAEDAAIQEIADTSYGMTRSRSEGDAVPQHGGGRVEVRCGSCSAHLGHVFDDGPKPTGLRYCINGVALALRKR